MEIFILGIISVILLGVFAKLHPVDNQGDFTGELRSKFKSKISA